MKWNVTESVLAVSENGHWRVSVVCVNEGAVMVEIFRDGELVWKQQRNDMSSAVNEALTYVFDAEAKVEILDA